ncbi:MAG TPA: glycoside hydrolase family 2 TIM barrel-domain containing protein, partial [Acidobacteriaceae bacterium]|nr:glycoside hydrolase family 2 TIM barrel-domain containing protein [Acidobacteriaceae bacterium]
GQHETLTFNGINYAAVVWLNGHQMGTVKGAFIRGVFDVTGVLQPGKENALAVLISPPPHPGIPNEQSIQGGPGENGGILCIDGPTFVATEGWDWIPGVRDRDTGIWQDVQLHATRQITIGDPQVVTTLPLPDISRANVAITVPFNNVSESPVAVTLTATFGTVTVTKHLTAQPGMNTVTLAPAEFPQLTVVHPQLWWPNGYGEPYLYSLQLQMKSSTGESDQKHLRFGIREVTYELSLLDAAGHLRRVEYSPTVASANHQQVVDVSHHGMREIPQGWAASLLPGAESSPAIQPLNDMQMTPYLVIKVNGVRIAARGGNWGMDDSRKRVSRAHLEPYFRLHRDAHLNIIRNWVGQDTEATFYDLADEYGLMVWNDFWDSTQNYNVEAEDPALFLANARDTILRFRNHPSIVMWCGRNEGVPQPIISNALDHLTRTLDGTRYYSPSSNQVNLQVSGPYHYQDPTKYYTVLNKGFSVETGTPSMSTLESFQHWIPKQDQWPISDDWAYHDWHQSGNGDTNPFMAEIDKEFGAPTSLADFERKAQMLNYVDHRAIFEGFNAHLWSPNSGRLLWMTQPAWPSTMWQIFSSDYDTQASFYGVMEACEPVHVQLDLSNDNVAVVNTTTTALSGLSLVAQVFSLDSHLLFRQEQAVSVQDDSTAQGFHLDLASKMGTGVVFVELQLKDGAGKVLSRNLYWLGASSQAYRALNTLPNATLTASATVAHPGNIQVTLKNSGNSIVLAAKLTLENSSDGSRILPAYYSDNYVSLLPGETRTITIEYPEKAAASAPKLALRGWNLAPTTVGITAK